MQRAILVVLFVLLTPVLLRAQKTEVAVTVGATLSPDAKGFITCGEAIFCPIPPNTIGSLSISPGVSWQASFARRVAHFKAAGLYIELPVVGSALRTTETGFLAPEFTSIFFTPSAQIKLLPNAAISPFASVGGGLAHFQDANSSGNTGALQVGGGLDVKTPWRLIALRAEARDFIAGRPGNLAFAGFTSNHFQHIFTGGGVVLKF